MQLKKEVNIPSNSFLSTVISRDFAYAKNPTISWYGTLFGPTSNKGKIEMIILIDKKREKYIYKLEKKNIILRILC